MASIALRETRFWVTHAWIPLALFVPLALLFQFTDLDPAIGNLFFDFERRQWIGGDRWWSKHLLHDGGIVAIRLILLSLLAAWAASFALRRLRGIRRPATYAILAMLLGSGTVAVTKHYSNVDCPWNLSAYNGNRPYVHVFSPRPAGLPQGQCFPGGHSSGGFSLFFLYFLFRGRSRRLARVGFGIALTVGTLFAVAQWSRGAHFVSHDLWSAAICWGAALLLYRWPFHAHPWTRPEDAKDDDAGGTDGIPPVERSAHLQFGEK